MGVNKEHWIKSEWAISILTAIFSLFLTIGYDYLKEKPILTTLWVVIKWVTNTVETVLNFELKVWWILIAIFLFILILIIINKYKNENSFKPDFYSYNEDKLKKWRWTWGWDWNRGKNA